MSRFSTPPRPWRPSGSSTPTIRSRWDRVPKLTLAMVRSDLLLDESAVCDRILSSASDSITEASGLYVDGRFIGAVESRAALDGLLGGILDSHRDGSGTDQAQFLQDVKVVDGLYPLTSTISADAMRTHLTAQTVVEKRYAAEPGDSYNRIAGKHGMTVSELKALNPDQGGYDPYRGRAGGAAAADLPAGAGDPGRRI